MNRGRFDSPRETILRALLLVALVAVAGCAGGEPAFEPEEAESVVVYTGARLIVGDGQVIDNATFAVDNGQFVAVGAFGEVFGPAGAETVDLSGMTVMPTIVDAHTHMSTTREALVSDLQQRAALGIGAVMSLGADGVDAPLDVRSEFLAGAAQYKSAGRGITSPEPGRSEVPHWVTTEEEARQAVRDEVARGVDFIKIWVDDRDGQYEKLSPELYAAVIDEAHQNGLKVAAHIFTLEDAKGLARAGIDMFAHGVRDMDVDDEFIELIRERPEIVLVPNMAGRGEPTDLSAFAGLIPDDAIEAAAEAPEDNRAAVEAFGIQARNLERLNQAGMRVAFGTDGNTVWAPHVEMEDMVASGMTPAEVLVAATNNAAELAGFTDVGTIAVGKRADFVVLSANPLDEITNTRQIASVYIRGDAVSRN